MLYAQQQQPNSPFGAPGFGTSQQASPMPQYVPQVQQQQQTPFQQTTIHPAFHQQQQQQPQPILHQGAPMQAGPVQGNPNYYYHQGQANQQPMPTEMYQPVGVTRVRPGEHLSGGMMPTYDPFVVPTYEAPLVVEAEPRIFEPPRSTSGSMQMFGAEHPQPDVMVAQRGISGDAGESMKQSTRRIPAEKRKPQRWCC
eukprot:Polyplicarium_translucidae@DN823_c0_g1_i1.p2